MIPAARTGRRLVQRWSAGVEGRTGGTGERVSEMAAGTPALTRTLLLTMAVACGLAIANLYYNQPLLAQIGHDLHASDRQVGALPMLTQAGFALGVFLVAPLGDVLERRRLILTMLCLVSLSLACAAFAPGLAALSIASFAVGITSVISTLVLPFAVSLTSPQKRGATVGTIAGAMLIGVLCSRTLSGVIGQFWGWRVMYVIATGMMAGLALVLRKLLPESRPPARLAYGELLLSMFRLIKQEPLLREATINGMLLYAALSAFWATLAFYVESPAWRMGPAVAGLFGLVGAGSALAAPLVGRLTDRRSPRQLVGAAAVVMLVSFGILWTGGGHLIGLILGVIGLDIAAQAATVSNQATVYSLKADAHSRMYTVYRAAYSLGGSVGAYLGALAWSAKGWGGVCAVGAALLIVALVLHSIAAQQAKAAYRR